MPFTLNPKMWAKIFVPLVGLLCGASLPLTSSQADTGEILVCTLSASVPEGMMIMWQAGGQSGNTSGIISASIGSTSSIRVGLQLLFSGRYTCQISLPESQTEVNEPADKGKGLHENLYRANHKESSLQRAQTVLTGMVIGLNASEVSVQWVKNALLEGRHVNPRVLKGSIKDSLLAISQVVVPYSDWNNGTSYSCTFTRTAGTVEPTQRPEEKSQGEK
ncbi:---NA--- [Podarcis lilfordi]|uniref:---NA n=1 Tax=Podarcis lilfordi TaxID=74358 RepID=A0AA35L8L6_9SAUR|nr:---NA--- [Podarcis lilfordi]